MSPIDADLEPHYCQTQSGPDQSEVDTQAACNADATDAALAAEVLEAIKTVRDPEIPVNLVDLGLIYRLAAGRAGVVRIEMTLTTPACPVAGSLPGQVQQVVSMVPGVNVVLVRLVWSPPWTRERMSEEARLELGLL